MLAMRRAAALAARRLLPPPAAAAAPLRCSRCLGVLPSRSLTTPSAAAAAAAAEQHAPLLPPAAAAALPDAPLHAAAFADDAGWGPVNAGVSFLEAVQSATGLPWCVSPL
jgi:hypothetical protein